MMLEDDFTDVLKKAMVGCGVELQQVADAVNVDFAQLERFADGEFSEDTARAVAPFLGLKADAYAKHPSYQPAEVHVEGLQRLVMPFGPYDVNAWWLEAGGIKLLFDAGNAVPDLMEALPANPDEAFITHHHRDHVAGVKELIALGVMVHRVDLLEKGEEDSCGELKIKACDLSGHATPQFGFHIKGLEKPVLVVGDALFAGSIGKCGTPELYQHALERLHAVLDPLDASTILLPGHGPATTVGEERESNPFL